MTTREGDLENARQQMREYSADLEALRPFLGTPATPHAQQAWDEAVQRFDVACEEYARALENLSR